MGQNTCFTVVGAFIRNDLDKILFPQIQIIQHSNLATNMALTMTNEAYLSILECQLYPEGSPLNYGLVNSIQSAKRTSVKHCDVS